MVNNYSSPASVLVFGPRSAKVNEFELTTCALTKINKCLIDDFSQLFLKGGVEKRRPYV